MTKNYYDILGVEETATYSEIAEAYNHLSESYNPANFENNPVFLNIYEEIQEAYNILGNLSSRREYDVQLKKSSMVNYPEDKIEDELEINSPEEDKNSSGIGREEEGPPPIPELIGTPPPLPDYPEEKLFSTKGRIGRLKYFIRFFIPLAIVIITLGIREEVIYSGTSFPYDLMTFISITFSLIFLIIQTIKRYQDLNSSGWFTLLLFVPIISIFTLLYLFLASGTMGANKYGLPPD